MIMPADPLMLQTASFFCLLAAVAVCDIRHREIPDWLQLGLAALSLLDFSLENFLGICIAVPYLMTALIPENSEGIGGGDIKLAGSTGLVLGFPAALAASVLGLTAFIVFGSGHYALKRFQGRKEKMSFPLGPFLAAGCIFAYYFKMKGWIY